ncbi:MAG: hypothetical protein KIS76_08020 [Pyrinomonadaceae bacterium]|nr:hypothetical protein [Pyrinomonadaceae bacterium]
MTKGTKFVTESVYLCFLIAALFLNACGQNVSKIMVNEDQENTPNAPTGDSNMAPLDDFIFKSDPFNKEIVPRELDAKNVAEFLIKKINASSELKHLIQAEKAADFYDTFEIAPKFKEYFSDISKTDDELLRSIVLVRTIARVGKPEDIEFAKQAYLRLIPRLDTQQHFEEVIKLHEILGLGTKSSELRAKIKQKIGELDGKKDTEYSAEIELLNFQGAIEQQLSRAEKVQDTKNSIVAMTDRKKRLEKEIAAYLALEFGFEEYLESWSAKRLRRETWAASPLEQTERVDTRPFAKEVATAFRDFLSDPRIKSLEEEEKEFAEIRILRAIKFFGGKLKEQEVEFLAQFVGKQADTLANEGFLLPKTSKP